MCIRDSSFPELQFVSLLYFQQLPYVSHPFFQLGNVGIVEMPGAVDAAADVVDAVSYTHLDVYKRQQPHTTRSAVVSRFPVMRFAR